MYENKKILILGAARSGIAIAKLLAKYHNDLTIVDLKKLPLEEEENLKNLGVKIIIEENQEDLIDNSYDLIIKNPAIMYTSRICQKIKDLNIRLENEIEVAYHFLPKNVKIIGITGSNGKTTTTTIVYELLKRMNIDVTLGGNIGYPLASIINDIKENSYLLLEISDHQLCDIHDFKTNISALLNICPTHLDYHGNYEHYRDTKGKIFNKHNTNDISIINYKNEDALLVSKDISSHKIYFNNEDNYYDDKGIYINKELILERKNIKLQGNHNMENILAALLIIKNITWNIDIIKEFFKTFNGVEHRLEFVREYKNVTFYNDSKATNPTATITALKTFDKPIDLILGGQERKQDFHELDPYMHNVTKIYAIGTVTDRVVTYAEEMHIKVIPCYNLNTALEKIKDNLEEGHVVLLSTASASQDQYAKFEDRGKEFKDFVLNL